MPAGKRQAAYSVYSICRLSDDIVDKNPDTAREEDVNRLEKVINQAYGGQLQEDPLIAVFAKTVADYDIPVKHFHELLEGMRRDIHKKRYRDFNELYDYCHKVAGVVGLVMLRILSGDNYGDFEEYSCPESGPLVLRNADVRRFLEWSGGIVDCSSFFDLHAKK